MLFTAFLWLLSLTPAGAQRYTPHERWPFVNEDFASGELILYDGRRFVQNELNVSVVDGKLYFIERDSLKAVTGVVKLARIAGEEYILANNRLMKVLRRAEHGAVLLDNEVNREAMGRSDVGYGFKSSVSSTEKRSVLYGESGQSFSLRLEQRTPEGMKALKNAGEELILKEVKYVLVDGFGIVRAIKPDVRRVPGPDKKDLDAFWKERKVKYSDDDSLAALADFLYNARQ